jgi:sugar phosphate permease
MEVQTPKNEANSYRWIILTLTVFCFIMTFLIRFTWPPLIPVVVPLLKMSMTQAGAYMSAFYIGYVITQVPAGILADRFGVRIILASSLVLEGITTWGMGAVNTFEIGFWLRIATGLGAGAVYSACARALMEWFPVQERGTAFGIMLAAPSIGMVLANFLVPALNTSIGWRGAFEVIGIATAIIGIVLYFLIKADDSPKSAQPLLGGFKVVFSSRDLLLTALAGFGLLWVELGIATWAVAHIRKLGFGLVDAGMVLIWYGVGGIVAPVLSGWLSDVLKNRKTIIIAAYILSVPTTVVFGYQTTLFALSVWAFIMGLAHWAGNPHLTILVSEYAGREWAATANGVANCFFQAAPIIGSIVMGWSIDVTGSFNTVWYIMAAGPLLGAVLLLFIRTPQQLAAQAGQTVK